MVWLDIYSVGGTLHFLGHWGSHNGYIPVGATMLVPLLPHIHYIPVGATTYHQNYIKTLYFYMERRKVSLNTTIKRPPKL